MVLSNTAVTDRWETSSSHDYKRRIDSAKNFLQLSWKHLFLFNRCPRNTQTHYNLPHPQHPTGFHKSPICLRCSGSSPPLGSKFLQKSSSQWVSSVRWLQEAMARSQRCPAGSERRGKKICSFTQSASWP